MPSPIDLESLESGYQKLQDALQGLSNFLVHNSDDAKLIEAFRTTGSTAMDLFRAEETAMEAVDCPNLQSNRMGHRKFLNDLGQVLSSARTERTGIPAAGILRREVIPWLREHHAVVDRQMVLYIRRAQEA